MSFNKILATTLAVTFVTAAAAFAMISGQGGPQQQTPAISGPLTRASVMMQKWSTPTYVSTYGTQYRWTVDSLQVLGGNGEPDLLVMVEPLDSRILSGLQEKYGTSLAYEPTTLTGASVIADTQVHYGDESPVNGTQLPDGRWLVRVPAPTDGWFNQGITLTITATGTTESGEEITTLDEEQLIWIMPNG